MSSNPELSIVIVNYNGGELIMECLASLREHPCSRPYETLVVDNASSDDSPARIRAEHPEVRLIRREDNAGLTKAMNHGMAEAQGRFVLSLDNDTVMLPGSLDAMVGYLDDTPRSGACAVKLVNPDGTAQHTARAFPSAMNAFFGRRSKLTQWFPNNRYSKRYLMADLEETEKPYLVDSLSAACLLLRAQALADIGGWDEDFFVYWCDTDLCFRLKKGGWEIASLPGESVIHNENSVYKHRKNRRTKSVIDFHKGVFLVYKKHYVRSRWNPMLAVAAAGLSARAGFLILADELSLTLSRLRA